MLCYDSELKQAITRTKMRKNRIRTDAFEIQQKASYSNFKLHCMLVKRTLYFNKRSISHYKKTNTAHFLNLRGDFAETEKITESLMTIKRIKRGCCELEAMKSSNSTLR